MAKNPEKLTVKIFYDTWVGEERIYAVKATDPKTGKPTEYAIVDLPFDQALGLLTEKKAERADPLPTA